MTKRHPVVGPVKLRECCVLSRTTALLALCCVTVSNLDADLASAPLAPLIRTEGATMFTQLSPENTGIVAENRYDDPRMWNELYHEFEVGAIGTGIAIADYDGDGRPDVFVVSKTESCRLFRNLGDWKFEDVTVRAGVADVGAAAKIWKQGAAFADVNNDGRPDLHVCRHNAPNLLYINQGDGTFREESSGRGLAVADGSSMAAFCDYDRDGWLDVFIQTNLLNNATHPNGRRDYLFRNNRDGTFSNVTDAAGISREETQGHSATWWDFNNDGWPDLYVANDFAPPDILYRNNGDGTFTDVLARTAPHTPYSAMGADLGDVNNDGLIDFMVADMAATSHQKDQRTMADSRGKTTDLAETFSGIPQYLHNALFLNTGTGRLQEAAWLAGLEATDWTWSPRFEDLDNDGRLDLHVTNGMHREIHNADLILRMMGAESAAERVRTARSSPLLAEANLAYRNLGDLRFEEVGARWGLNRMNVSFGAAFGDLDGDGDLDLVYANYQGGPTVLRNDCPTGHRIIIALRGTGSNRFGVGAIVRLESASGVQVRPLVLARGYLSTSEPVLHFGLGEDQAITRLTVTWPSGNTQTFTELPVDRHFTITEPDTPAAKLPANTGAATTAGLFAEVGAVAGPNINSREAVIDEISAQRLLPMRHNRGGPALAVGALSGDGSQYLTVGGTTLDPLRLFRLGTAGDLTAVGLPARESTVNDGPLLSFDANGDSLNDLLVTRGGSALPYGSPEYQPELFLNSSNGLRAAPAGSLPPLPVSVGAVAAADFDRDGRLDVFIGGRVQPADYPSPPRSALLVNRGGRFTDETDRLAPGLSEVGMVTSALWSDADGDGWLDLLLTMEWGHVRFFHNDQGRGFTDRTEAGGFAAAGTGWWTSLASADFNGDGRPDYVAGNLGLNTQYRASPERPAVLYYDDFSGDGTYQLIEGYYEGDKLFPRRSRRDLGSVLPFVLKKYPRNDFYARATLADILGQVKLDSARRFTATEFRSGVFLSRPEGTHVFFPLPRIAQIAPFQGLAAGDFDGDGRPDIYAVQNSYSPNPVASRFDGGISQFLRGDGRGGFVAVPPAASNLVVPGDARALAVLDGNGDGWPDFFVSRNHGSLLHFRHQGVPGRRSFGVRLQGAVGNPTAIGARITVELVDGSSQTAEVHAGSGYFSQSSATCFFGHPDDTPVRRIVVRWPDGTTSTTDAPRPASLITLNRP